MKMRNLKLFGIALSGVLSMACLTGCESVPQKYSEEKGCLFTRQFDIGEHIISIPLKNDISKKTMQIEAHPGYEVMGISMSAYGQYSKCFAGGLIMYSNSEIVECKSNLYNENGELIYLDFGIPLDYEEENNVSDEEIKEFDVGEHIISIPLVDDVSKTNAQYKYFEGYEAIGITTTAYGQYSQCYGGGAILYKNIVPVRARRQEDGYTAFGEVIEVEKERGLN